MLVKEGGEEEDLRGVDSTSPQHHSSPHFLHYALKLPREQWGRGVIGIIIIVVMILMIIIIKLEKKIYIDNEIIITIIIYYYYYYYYFIIIIIIIIPRTMSTTIFRKIDRFEDFEECFCLIYCLLSLCIRPPFNKLP